MSIGRVLWQSVRPPDRYGDPGDLYVALVVDAAPPEEAAENGCSVAEVELRVGEIGGGIKQCLQPLLTVVEYGADPADARVADHEKGGRLRPAQIAGP